MVMAEQSQVWVGSEDSVIYIINVHSMSCNKQLTDHRSSVTGLAVQDGVQGTRCAGLHWGGAPASWAGRGPRGQGPGGQAGGAKQVWEASHGTSLHGSGHAYGEVV